MQESVASTNKAALMYCNNFHQSKNKKCSSTPSLFPTKCMSHLAEQLRGSIHHLSCLSYYFGNLFSALPKYMTYISFSMIFFLLDLIFWQIWGLLTWCLQYLGPLILLVQLVRLVRADADLTLLMYEKFGMMPGEWQPHGFPQLSVYFLLHRT